MERKFKLLAVAATLAAFGVPSAQALDFGGYFRVGPGQKEATNCFGGHLDGGTYRLGNECDTYGEFALSEGGKAGGVDYKATLMTNFYRTNSDIDDTKLGVNQIYAEGKGFDVAPNQTFWVGKRFYGRADVHIVDTFFTNLSGTGAGVDGINLGFAKLNVAGFRNNEPGSRINLDLTDINVNPGGKLRVTAAFTKFGTPGGKNGSGISLQHNQANFLGGENTLWLQYAQGSTYLNMNFGGATDDSSVKKTRIVESMAWTSGPLSGQAIALFGQHKSAAGTQKFSTVGGRVGYAFTNNFKLQGELGVSTNKPAGGGQSERITKFTIAPTLTKGPGFYDRPELRLYVTGASWNDAYRLSEPKFGADKSGTSVGVQVEMWF